MTETIEPNFPDGTPIQLVHFEPSTGEFKKSKPRIVGFTKVEHLETEPIFGIHITFADGSKPMEWFNLNLTQAAKVLTDMSEDWILVPEDVKLNGETWKWHANVRRKEAESREKIETYADILDPLYHPIIEEETEPCE